MDAGQSGRPTIARRQGGWIGLGLLALLCLVSWVGYEAWGSPARVRAAKVAIRDAVEACSPNISRPVFEEKYLAAESAIENVGGAKEMMLSTGLDNQIHEVSFGTADDCGSR